MPETARELIRPLTAAEMEEARRQKREKEQWGHGKLPGLWPDIRPQSERNQSDITQITRDIARGS